MYLARKVDVFLEDWKNNIDRKPLIIKGPRQAGKRNQSKDSPYKIMKI